MLTTQDVDVLETPMKSLSDKKEYKLIKLQNELKVLLVKEPSKQNCNDMSSGIAAVALSVDIGSFQDPPEVQGLAHYLEHLLFMGSQKYPKENDFDRFIKNRCGCDNAMTEVEFTIFYFSIVEEHLAGALDRFSQFFISPLMLAESMKREMEAVESEFQNIVNVDVYRINQIYASMVRNEHPASHFTWGNSKTLNHGQNRLYKIVHEFRRKFYRSNLMHLCIQSTMELDALQNLVVQYFSDIKLEYGTILKPMSIDPFADVFKPEFYRKMYLVKSATNKRKLFLTFLLPTIEKNYLDKSLEYLAYLLDYQNQSSLHTYLKEQGLAISLTAKIGSRNFDGNSMFTFFTVEVAMTKFGNENINSILKAIFSYLFLIKNTSMEKHAEIYKEFKDIKTIKFNFSNEKSSLENVQDLAVNMKYYQNQDIIVGTKLCSEFNESLLKEMIDRINDHRFNLLILSDKYKKFDRVEPWFQTEYAKVDLPCEYVKLWNERWFRKDISLPTRNQFICSSFEIYSEPEDSSHPRDEPLLILETENCRFFHKLDKMFHLPYGFINIHFMSSLTEQSVTNINMTSIFVICVKNFLSEKLYPATVVGYNYKINSVDSGIIVQLSGFNEKLSVLLDVIIQCIVTVGEAITEPMFSTYCKDIKKFYYNYLISSNRLNEDCRLKIIKQNYAFYFDRFKNIEEIVYEDFKNFTKTFLSSLKSETLIQGNLTKKQALVMTENFAKHFQIGEMAKFMRNPTKAANTIPIGATYYKVKSMLRNDTNSVIKNYYQIGRETVQTECLLEILQRVINEPLFNTLRTQEQLGYSVCSSVKNDDGTLGFTITIESQESKNPASLIDEKIERFLKTFLKTLEAMNDEDFEIVISSIVAQKRLVDSDLKSEVNRNWTKIKDGKYNFNRSDLEVEMQKVCKNDLIEFYKEHFNYPENVRKLSVQVLANADSYNSIDVLHLDVLKKKND